LSIALTTFLVGLGLYLGKMYTAELVPTYGAGSIGILVFYLVSAVVGIGMFYLPETLKYFESTPLLRFRKIVETRRAVPLPTPHLPPCYPQRAAFPPTRRASGENAFTQSWHLRQGGKLRYTDGIPSVMVEDIAHQDDEQHKEEKATLAEDNSVKDQDHRPELCASVTNQRCSVDEWVSRKTSPASSSQDASDAVLKPEDNAKSVRAILQDLLQVHEESLRINRRLLEALGSTSLRG
jgi:hypothetical protein